MYLYEYDNGVLELSDIKLDAENYAVVSNDFSFEAGYSYSINREGHTVNKFKVDYKDPGTENVDPFQDLLSVLDTI